MTKSFNRRLTVTLTAATLLLLAACGAAPSAQQSDAQKAGILLSTALAAHTAGQTAVAAADYRKVITYDPQNKWAHYNLGVIEQNDGQNAAAEADYRAVLVVDPNFTGALYNLAILRTVIAPQEAVDLYRHAVSIAPSMGSAHLNLGFLLISLGQQTEGQAELNRAVAIEPALAQRISKPAPATSKKP